MLKHIIATVLLSAWLVQPAIAERLPAKTFAQHPQFSSVAMSPNGKHFAITTPIDNRTDLMIVDISGAEAPKRVHYQANEHIIAPFWVSDDRLLLAKARKEGFRAQPRGTGEVYSLDTKSTRQELLFGYVRDSGNIRGRRKDTGFARVIDRVPGSKGDVLFYYQDFQSADKQTSVYRVDAYTGERDLIEQVPLRGAAIAVDRKLRPRFAASSDDDSNPVLRYRPAADSDWTPVPASIAGRDMSVLAFEEDDNTAWAEISDAGEPTKIYRVDFAKGTRELVFGRDDMDVGGVMYTGHSGVPFAIWYDAGKPAVQYFDPSSDWAKLHAGLMKMFAGSLVRFVDFSRDDNTVLLLVVSDRNPGTFYVLDRAKNKVSKLQSAFPDIDPKQMAPTMPVSFKASDDVQLNAFLTLPIEGTKPFPVVVLPHGGPHGPYDRWSFDPDVQFLANRGYAVLQVNIRGSGGRGENFMKSGYRKWGTRIMDDIIDGLKYVAAQGLVNPDRACIYGASFGGYAALMAPVRSPGTFRCAIGYLGVYDLKLLHSHGDSNDTRRGRNSIAKFIGTDDAELAANSPALQGGKVGIPVLLAAGKDDVRAPLVHTKSMAEALEKAGTPVDLMVKPGEGHGFYDEKNRIELYEKMEAFLDRHIGAKAK